MRKLYRGIWADKLELGQELPIGGSIFGDELTIKLILDFDSFNGQLENYHSPDKLSKAYEQNKESVESWLTQNGSKADPYLFFVANSVQRKVQMLMQVNPHRLVDSFERFNRFKKDRARLTDLRGLALCAEQSAFGQYLLQNVLEKGYSSSYMGGVVSQDQDLKNSTPKTLIFDIARPHSKNNFPRILETDVPFSYELFDGKQDFTIGATEVLEGGR